MNPQDSEAVQADSEDVVHPLVAERWQSREKQLIASGCCLICSLVIGSYFWAPLLAAFEADESLAWRKETTAFVITLSYAMEASGLIFAGPLGDIFNARRLLGFQSFTICLGMTIVSLSKQVNVMLWAIAMVTLVKGVMWPCIGSVIVANMSSGKRGTAFLLAATGSRIADVSQSLLLGLLMGTMGFNWRHSLSTVLTLVLILLLIATTVAPAHIAGPGDKEPSAYGLLEKWQRLLRDPDGWLAFGSVFGTYFVWTLFAYATVLLRDMYIISVAWAVSAASAMPVGHMLGLMVGTLASQLLSPSYSHLVHVCQGCIGLLALFLLAQKVTFPLAIASLVALGFATVTLSYLPYFEYANTAPETDRAFRLAVLDGTALALSMLISYAYGQLRENSDPQDEYAPKIFLVTAGGLLLSLVCSVALYCRLGQFPCARCAE